MFERGARRNGSCHDPPASRASTGCLLCQGVFVPSTVSSFLCQGVAPGMIGGRNGIMAGPVPPTTISNHIAFPRPPINDFRYLIASRIPPGWVGHWVVTNRANVWSRGKEKEEEGTRRKKKEQTRRKGTEGEGRMRKKKEEGRRKKEEGRRKKEEGRRKKEEGRRKTEERMRN